MGLRIVEFAVESLSDAIGTCFSHQMVPPVIMCGRYQRHGSVARKTSTPGTIVIPIAKSHAQYVTRVLRCQIIDIALHRLVVLSDETIVTIVLLIEKRQRDKYPAPFWRFEEGFCPVAGKHGIFWSCLRHSSIGVLGICHVLHGLLYHRSAVVVVEQCLAVEPVLFEPSQFLTVRAIGPYRLPVAAYGTVDDAVGGIDAWVATLKTAGAWCCIIDKAGSDMA